MANVTIAAAFLELKQHKVSIANQVWARGLGQGLKFFASKQYAARVTLFPAAYTISNPYFKIDGLVKSLKTVMPDLIRHP